MSVWEVLFPRTCFCCGYLGVYVCPSCEKRLVAPPHTSCFYCRKPSLLGLTHPACRRKNGIDGFTYLLQYNNPLKLIIKKIKYSLVLDAQKDIYRFLYLFGTNSLVYYGRMVGLRVQSIPTSITKKRTRGYNQADIVAEGLCYCLKTKQVDLLERRYEKKPQAQIHTPFERRKNVKGAFCIKKGIVVPERVLLVDDVVTTGATTEEAAAELKKAGVKHVFVFSVARG
ncbi:MAG: phosphoribosyltransferase family protein [Patescibacteria group bacterium]